MKAADGRGFGGSEDATVSPPSVRVVIVGPTATGKSELALDLADALTRREDGPAAGVGVEVLNADASQLYRGMDIGTAKVPAAGRRGYPHHQVDVLDVHEDASVAAYQRHARTDLDAIEARGARALIVGGSGLYVRAVTDALEFPGTDPAVRADLQGRARHEGTRRLWEELEGEDPDSARRIDPADTRRIVRALEVLAVTGRPFSATLPRYEDVAPTLHLALRPDRAALEARIDARAADMFAAGLREEVENLVAAGLTRGTTASRAIGYAQAIDLLAGRITRERAVELTARATRRLASHQFTWFRRDPRIHWLDVGLDARGRWLPGERERVTRQAVRLVARADESSRGVA